jgi:hypothetical protein
MDIACESHITCIFAYILQLTMEVEVTINTINATLFYILSFIGKRSFIATCFSSASNHLQEIYIGFPRKLLHLQQIRCFGSDNLSHLFLVIAMFTMKLHHSAVLNISS